MFCRRHQQLRVRPLPDVFEIRIHARWSDRFTPTVNINGHPARRQRCREVMDRGHHGLKALLVFVAKLQIELGFAGIMLAAPGNSSTLPMVQTVFSVASF